MAETTAHIREVIRLADLVVASPKIMGRRFEDCLILGPAIVATTGETTINGCSFDAEADALLWRIEPSRQFVVGAIEVVQCEFLRCRFSMVGFAGGDDFIELFKESVK